MKRYINTALLYAIFAMAGGVFYREFTKFNGFTGKTTLSVVHTHYFLLGMVFFLLLLLLEKNFSFTGAKTGRVLAAYHIGLNLTAVMFVVRGIAQVRMLLVTDENEIDLTEEIENDFSLNENFSDIEIHVILK